MWADDGASSTLCGWVIALPMALYHAFDLPTIYVTATQLKVLLWCRPGAVSFHGVCSQCLSA